MEDHQERRDRCRGYLTDENSVMRNGIIVSILTAVVSLSVPVFAQDSPQPTWHPCPRCVLDTKNAEAVARLKDHAFNPHDLSGVWGNNDLLLDTKTVPPM